MGVISGLVKTFARRPAATSSETQPGKSGTSVAPALVDGADALPARLADARHRIESNPDDADAWYALASTLKQWGRSHEAIAAFRAAYDRDR